MPVFIGGVFSLIGVIIALFVSHNEKKVRRRFKNYGIATGKVTDFARHVDTTTLNPDVSYFAVFEYRVKGLVYSVTSVVPLSDMSYHGKDIGGTESVLYNADNPAEAVIDREISVSGLLTWIAFGFALIGLMNIMWSVLVGLF